MWKEILGNGNPATFFLCFCFAIFLCFVAVIQPSIHPCIHQTTFSLLLFCFLSLGFSKRLGESWAQREQWVLLFHPQEKCRSYGFVYSLFNSVVCYTQQATAMQISTHCALSGCSSVFSTRTSKLSIRYVCMYGCVSPPHYQLVLVFGSFFFCYHSLFWNSWIFTCCYLLPSNPP